MPDRTRTPILIAALMAASIFVSSFATEVKFPLLWQVELKSLLESAPTVADINEDGRDEVVIAGMEEIIALDRNGKELWRYPGRRLG